MIHTVYFYGAIREEAIDKINTFLGAFERKFDAGKIDFLELAVLVRKDNDPMFKDFKYKYRMKMEVL